MFCGGAHWCAALGHLIGCDTHDVGGYQLDDDFSSPASAAAGSAADAADAAAAAPALPAAVAAVLGGLSGEGVRSRRPGYAKLRLARRLEEGMVLTVRKKMYFKKRSHLLCVHIYLSNHLLMPSSL